MTSFRTIPYSFPIGGLGFPSFFIVSDQILHNHLPEEIWNNIRDRLMAFVMTKELKLWATSKEDFDSIKHFIKRENLEDRLRVLHSILFVNKSWYKYVIGAFDWTWNDNLLLRLYFGKKSFYIQNKLKPRAMSMSTLISFRMRCLAQQPKNLSLHNRIKQNIVYVISSQRVFEWLYVYGEETVLAGYRLQSQPHFIDRKILRRALSQAYSELDIELMWKLLKGSFYDCHLSLVTRVEISLLTATRIIIAALETWTSLDGTTYRERICPYRENFEKSKFTDADGMRRFYMYYLNISRSRLQKSYQSDGHILTIWLAISTLISQDVISIDVGGILKSYSIIFLTSYWNSYFRGY